MTEWQNLQADLERCKQEKIKLEIDLLTHKILMLQVLILVCQSNNYTAAENMAYNLFSDIFKAGTSGEAKRVLESLLVGVLVD